MTVAFQVVAPYHPAHWSGMEPDVLVECPKCRSPNARYVADEVDVTLRCNCGYHKVVATKLQEMTIEHIDFGDDVRLPARGSKLWNCLAALAALQKANSQGITDAVNRGLQEKLTTSQVSSQLTVLRYKGLVWAPEEKKGVAGGSTWELTEAAKRFFGG